MDHGCLGIFIKSEKNLALLECAARATRGDESIDVMCVKRN